MLSHSEQHVLEEISRNSKSALLDIRTVLGKVYDEELALDLNRQAARYSRMEEKAADRLLDKGVIPEPISILDRTKRWASWQTGTALNVSTGHVAELMLSGEKSRYENMRAALRENEVTSSFTSEFAEEFLNFEEESMRILQDYVSEKEPKA